jgi:hypothetical protein
LRPDAEAAQGDPLLKAISLCIDGVLMILNQQRQVVAVNRELLQALGIPDVGCLIGMRPGEVLRCVHAWEGPGGCGTSRACASCGAECLFSEEELPFEHDSRCWPWGIEEAVPCAGPRAGGSWRNHGSYVNGVAHLLNAALANGLITEPQHDALMEATGESSCGK